jgi:hypothetical protein
MPLPWFGRVRHAGPLDNQPDPDAGIIDVPGDRPVIDAFAGEDGHAPHDPPDLTDREAARFDSLQGAGPQRADGLTSLTIAVAPGLES